MSHRSSAHNGATAKKTTQLRLALTVSSMTPLFASAVQPGHCYCAVPATPQVCESATKHFAAAQPNLAFLQDVEPPAADTKTDSADTEDSSSRDQLEAPSGDWISKAASVDLVWLYFALYKHFHHGK